MYYKRSRSSVKGQGHSVKHRLIAKTVLHVRKARSNADVRILIGRRAVCAHAQYNIGQDTA